MRNAKLSPDFNLNHTEQILSVHTKCKHVRDSLLYICKKRKTDKEYGKKYKLSYICKLKLASKTWRI